MDSKKLDKIAERVDGLTHRLDSIENGRKLRNDAGFDEGKHPRDGDGKFSSSNAAEASSKASTPAEHLAAAKLHEKAAAVHSNIRVKAGFDRNSHHHETELAHLSAAQEHRRAVAYHPEGKYGGEKGAAQEHKFSSAGAKNMAKKAQHLSTNPENKPGVKSIFKDKYQ
jgi:hypothetical protein